MSSSDKNRKDVYLVTGLDAIQLHTSAMLNVWETVQTSTAEPGVAGTPNLFAFFDTCIYFAAIILRAKPRPDPEPHSAKSTQNSKENSRKSIQHSAFASTLPPVDATKNFGRSKMIVTDAWWNGHAFECYLCHSTFKTKGGLNDHIWSPKHTIHFDDSHYCPNRDCSFTTESVQDFLQHIEDEVCGIRRFSSPPRTESQFAEVIKPRPASRPAPFATEVSWNGTAYECYLCHQTFWTLDTLNKHIGETFAHIHSMPYQCPNRIWCALTVDTLRELYAHIESNICGVKKFSSEEMMPGQVGGDARTEKVPDNSISGVDFVRRSDSAGFSPSSSKISLADMFRHDLEESDADEEPNSSTNPWRITPVITASKQVAPPQVTFKPWAPEPPHVPKDEEQYYDHPIGLLYLTSTTSGEANVGLSLLPENRAKGYGPQAVKIGLQWVFDELHFHRVQACVLDGPDKQHAIAMFTKMGFTHEGTRRRSHLSSTGVWLDTSYLALLDTEWEMRAYFKPAPRSLWEELFARHQREREELLRWDERRAPKRTTSLETLRIAAGSPLTAIETDHEAESEAEGMGKGRENPFSDDHYLTSSPPPPSESDLSSASGKFLKRHRTSAGSPASVSDSDTESKWDLMETSSDSGSFSFHSPSDSDFE